MQQEVAAYIKNQEEEARESVNCNEILGQAIQKYSQRVLLISSIILPSTT